MAAILNPTALTAPAPQRSRAPQSGTTLRGSTAFQSNPADQDESLFEGASPVAPWNRAEALEPRRPVRHLHLVTEPVVVAPAARRSPFRVLLAGLGLAVLVAFAAMGIVPFLGADAAASTPASSADTSNPVGADAQVAAASTEAPVVTPVAPVEIIVQSGDSLWTIARRLQPRGDLRRLVDRLIERVGATSVTRGQHIDVTGLVD